jgi:hypothetical protein
MWQPPWKIPHECCASYLDNTFGLSHRASCLHVSIAIHVDVDLTC